MFIMCSSKALINTSSLTKCWWHWLYLQFTERRQVWRTSKNCIAASIVILCKGYNLFSCLVLKKKKDSFYVILNMKNKFPFQFETPIYELLVKHLICCGIIGISLLQLEIYVNVMWSEKTRHMVQNWNL